LTQPNQYELWRLRLFPFGGYGLALAALALVVFGAIEYPPVGQGPIHSGIFLTRKENIKLKYKFHQAF